jgi:hypothetical protein
MERRLEFITSVAVAAGVIGQAAVLLERSPLNLAERVQFCSLTAGVAVLVVQLWRTRRYLTAHADMLLLMFSLGGAGMIAGLPDGASCHPTGWVHTFRMDGMMIMAGLLPAIPLSRCLRQARRNGTLVSTLALDTVGMLVGMRLASLVSFSVPPGWALIVSHALMMAAMLAGMAAAMTAGELWALHSGSANIALARRFALREPSP